MQFNNNSHITNELKNFSLDIKDNADFSNQRFRTLIDNYSILKNNYHNDLKLILEPLHNTKGISSFIIN